MVLALLLASLLSLPASAVEVVFLGVRKGNGEWLELENGSRFAHVAISYEGGWLHAHPLTGVAHDYDLRRYGIVLERAYHPHWDDPSGLTVESWIGLKYDHQFRWSDEKFYCSELVGKLLGLLPRPMDFSAPVWRGRIPSTDLGISPQGVYNDLKKLPGWEFRVSPDTPIQQDGRDPSPIEL
jgi:hypothetical protein